MAVRVSRSWQRLLILLFPIGLIVLLVAWLTRSKRNPQQTIKSVLEKETDLDPRMIRFYTAVSALETNFWSSSYFMKLNNLFNMTLPSKNTTAKGRAGFGKEPALARFDSVEDSAKDFVLYLFTRFNYPDNFVTLDDLAAYMKKKKYYESSEKEYAIRLNQVYKQLYGK